MAQTSRGVVVTLFPAWSFSRLRWFCVDMLGQSFPPLNGGHWQLRVISNSSPLLPLWTGLYIIFDTAHPLVSPALVVGHRREKLNDLGRRTTSICTNMELLHFQHQCAITDVKTSDAICLLASTLL